MHMRMYFTGYQAVGNVLKSRWLCVGLLLVSILAPSERSEAFESGGLGDEACFHFYLYKPSVTSTRIVSAKRTEYYLAATGQEGRPGCPGWMGPYTMRVAASWDAASQTASEQIEHGDKSSTRYIVTHIQAKCDKDPWMYYASCSLISAGTTPRSDGSSLTFDGPYPVSAAALTKAQKDALATLDTPSKGFILPPATPPVIESPVKDGIYRNGAPVSVTIRRPTDGDERWYAEHPEFDVEFEVMRPDAGMMWASVSLELLLGRTTLTTSSVSVALTNFSSHGPGKSGEWQTWRMRARVRDSAISRPWSAWQPFNVVVPITYEMRSGGVPLPGGGDFAGGSKRAPATAVQPAASGTVPMLPFFDRASFFAVFLPNGAKVRGQVVGNKLMLGGDTGKPTPAPDGIYKTGDGKSLVVQGGIIAMQGGEIKPTVTPGSPGATPMTKSIRESPLK